ncbi:unnamed protein product, partial [Ectocarpus sp. 8 AP-2014]
NGVSRWSYVPCVKTQHVQLVEEPAWVFASNVPKVLFSNTALEKSALVTPRFPTVVDARFLPNFCWAALSLPVRVAFDVRQAPVCVIFFSALGIICPAFPLDSIEPVATSAIRPPVVFCIERAKRRFVCVVVVFRCVFLNACVRWCSLSSCYKCVGSIITCRILERFLRLLPLPLLSLINMFVLFEHRRSPLEFSTARKFPYRRLKTTWRRRGSRLGEPREVKRW